MFLIHRKLFQSKEGFEMIKNFCPNNGNCFKKVYINKIFIGSVSELKRGKFYAYPAGNNKPLGFFPDLKEAEMVLNILAEIKLQHALTATNG